MEKLKGLLAAINLKHFNLKWVKHAIWIIALGSLFVYLNVAPPFLAVASDSMKPVFARGALVFSSGIDPNQIKAGDIIVFSVSPVFQEKYGYPATICHRVERIQNNEGKLYFRTKGDNNGSDDPFMTPGDNVIGLEKNALPLAGYGVLFAQSSQGKYFLVGLILLFLFFSNTAWLSLNAKKVRSSLVGISTAEFSKSQGELDQKLTSMGQNVAQSLNGFSGAMSEYAKHIASHTSAIKSLAEAANHMESILAKQDADLSKPLPQPVFSTIPQPVSVQPPAPSSRCSRLVPVGSA